MLRLLGNLALVAGTILGGIAAANSGRPWREVDLSGDSAGRAGHYLFDDVFLKETSLGLEPAPKRAISLGAVSVPTEFKPQSDSPGGLGYRYRIASSGSPLTPEVEARLIAAEHASAQVRHPALAAETVPRAQAQDRVLAQDVALGTQVEEVPEGRRITMRLLRMAASAGRAELSLRPVNGEPARLILPQALPADLDASIAALEAEISGLAPLLDKPLAKDVSAVRRPPELQMDPAFFSAEPRVWPRGTRLTREVIGELWDWGVRRVPVAGNAPDVGPGQFELPELLESDAALRAAAARELEPFVGQRELAESLTLEIPDVVPAGTFVDAALAERLAAADVDRVVVQIPASFQLADWELKGWFLVALGAMVLGIVLKRVAGHSAAPEALAGQGRESGASPRELLQRIEAAVKDLVEREVDLDVADIQAALDRLLETDVADFVRGREALRSRLGAHAFAEIFGPFSSAERKLARAWSAAVDEHIDEARESLRDALPHLEAALANCAQTP